MTLLSDSPLFDSFWQALKSCLHGKVIALTLLPLVLMSVLTLVPLLFFWSEINGAVQTTLNHLSVVQAFNAWLASIHFSFDWVPLVTFGGVTLLALVLAFMVTMVMVTPAMLNLVVKRRFPTLQKAHGGSFWVSVAGGLGCTLMALLVLFVSMPIWLIPPLFAVVPPLVWGWLTYKVMTYDVLADHASPQERKALIEKHQKNLFLIGLCTGYLGAIPSIAWLSGVIFVLLAPLMIPFAIWLYTLVFAFSALWFAHYALAALQDLRLESNCPC
jgi:hypothetical protein